MEYIMITLLIMCTLSMVSAQAVSLGAACAVKTNCTDANADCIAKTCRCQPTYFEKSSSCSLRIKVNEPCNKAESGCIMMAECISNNTCQCKEGFKVTAEKTCASSGVKLKLVLSALMFPVLLGLICHKEYM